ncbi:MAG: hypothetical protein JWR44_3532 [Hymenobacter sp.]|jgi:hypothetical protein|nr:hypothetical protein [Hymenobacter sp.]
MKRALLIGILSCLAVASHAQSGTLPVPPKAISQLEDLKELTKAEVAGKAKSKAHAEVRPDLNRYLVISADEFLRVASAGPTKEAYLRCIEIGLARVEPLTNGPEDRKQVAEYFQDLMEIVGLDSSDGRLSAFVSQPQAKK